jgi:tRNA A37 threonylcarbamoyladenosine synthetase subunit TsaC/SUA5/YrdC
LRLRDPAHRREAVDALIDGQIIVTAFNGIFVLVGDADEQSVAQKVAGAKKRPQAKGVALVCPPEFLAEHVALNSLVLPTISPLARIEDLYRSVHAVGLILPAALPGAPPHVVQEGTILNVWTEERPVSPLRELVLELRRRGRRALAGTSANRAGEPTIADPARVADVFADRVPLMLLDTVDGVPPERRRSASIVDLTGSIPLLVRQGSVPAEELQAEMRRLELGELAIAQNLTRV